MMKSIRNAFFKSFHKTLSDFDVTHCHISPSNADLVIHTDKMKIR